MNIRYGAILLAATMLVTEAQADTFGTGANQFSIDFVNIGHAGNVADSTGYGAVDHNYRIGMTEVTIDQIAKADAADNRISTGNENYWNDGMRTVGPGGPASHASWYEATKFANWLTTGDAYTGVYQFNGSGALTGVDRSYRNGNGIAYVLPTEDEWYKAAYYKPVDDSSYSLYASGLDTAPTIGTAGGWNYNYPGGTGTTWISGSGAQEQNGTYDMNGNVWEWTESAWDGTLDNMAEDRSVRGGPYNGDENRLRSTFRPTHETWLLPTHESHNIGLRIAAIPEPSSIAMIGMISGGVIFIRRWFVI